MNIEKWVSFLIIALVILIIAFNLVGALWMMVLEKKRDLSILSALGMKQFTIRNIFLTMGGMIVSIGIIAGIFLAIVFYFIQTKYGIIGVPNGFVMDAYPMHLKWSDFVVVTVTVLLIGIIGSIIPSYRAGKLSGILRQE